MEKHRIELRSKVVRSGHSVPYQSRSTTTQFTATELDCMLRKEVSELATTERARLIVLSKKKSAL